MKNKAELITLTIPSQSCFQKIATAVAQCLAISSGLPQKKIKRLKTAVAEAVINAIEHGNLNDDHFDVTIRFLQDQEKLEIIVEDTGIGGRVNLKTEAPDIDRQVLGLEPSRGWGLFLIGKLVDEFEVDTMQERGNLVRMVTYLESAPKHADAPS